MDVDYQILFVLATFCIYNVVKYLSEPYDKRIELSKEVFDAFVDCNDYHRYMIMSGIYDDDLDSDENYKKWEKIIHTKEQLLSCELKKQLGDFKDKYEILSKYKVPEE